MLIVLKVLETFTDINFILIMFHVYKYTRMYFQCMAYNFSVGWFYRNCGKKLNYKEFKMQLPDLFPIHRGFIT